MSSVAPVRHEFCRCRQPTMTHTTEIRNCDVGMGAALRYCGRCRTVKRDGTSLAFFESVDAARVAKGRLAMRLVRS